MTLKNIKLYTAPSNQAVVPYKVAEGFNEIELITDGEVFFGKDKNRYGPGSVFWHQTGDETVYLTSKEKPYSCVNFIFENTSEYDHQRNRIFKWSSSFSYFDFVNEVLGSYFQNGINSELSDFIYHNLNWNEKKYSPNKGRLKNLINAIQNNPANHWTSTNMAALLKISTSSLNRFFKEEVKSTAHQFLISQRLDKARQLLASTEIPIKNLPELTGFGGPESFCRSFKQSTGLTPRQYRLKHRPDNIPSALTDHRKEKFWVLNRVDSP